jgi:hypothetical protein
MASPRRVTCRALTALNRKHSGSDYNCESACGSTLDHLRAFSSNSPSRAILVREAAAESSWEAPDAMTLGWRAMASFRIAESALDISSFDLPLNRTIKLLQWGGDLKGQKLALSLNPSTTAVDLKLLPDKLPAASTAFTITGKQKGAIVSVSAFVGGTTQRYSEDLKLRVRGEPTKQPGYNVDMLSDLAIKGNAKQIQEYASIVTGPSDNTHILSQNTNPGHYNCGDVAAGYGSRFFPQKANTAYYVYYLPPTNDKMADLRFNGERVKVGITRIKSLVNQGIPVRVWLIHHDGFKPVIQGDTRTHFLTIIGYSATKFLYLDPWPGGSKLDYDGGMFAKTTISFMGELSFDMNNLSLGIGSPNHSKGLHKYKVIAGP